MKINRNLRLQMLAQSWIFVILFLLLVIIIGFLTSQYRIAKDITQANRNILTQGSVDILKQMKDPVNITVFASNDDASRGDTFRKGMIDFIARYQREKKDIKIKFVNPSEEPKLAQEAGIKVDGEVVVEYNKRTEHITPPFAEQEMTNLLVRLSRTNTKPIMFLDGHGERHMQGMKNHDLGEFSKVLESKGFKFANPDLTIAQAVPSNGAMLVIASPQVDLSDVEAKKIKAYIEAGGNVLWLLDDDNMHGLKEVADYLGVKVSPGIAVDMTAAQYGADAKVAFASAYGDHPITRTFQLRTLFPEAHEVDGQASYELGWKVARLVDVAPNGWLESDKLVDGGKGQKAVFDEKKDKRGPINVGIALERVYGKKGQRVVVMGNANFLSNTFITNGGNLDFGINIINWLAGDDTLITIQPMPLKDINVTIPSTDQGRAIAWMVFHGFQYFIPVGFFVAGFWLWWKRRKA
ncbi:MAG TPA: GldG family protein [Methylophilus sp.]|jgi:ABC-type uncharacterized transport system involved in gliding motility auxiliary subunit|nr:GldG family protein [Methylophilus sp.]HQQ32899.1 GldG family protein [Methylophilus sp.]